jgi:hypothetical protein
MLIYDSRCKDFEPYIEEVIVEEEDVEDEDSVTETSVLVSTDIVPSTSNALAWVIPLIIIILLIVCVIAYWIKKRNGGQD